MTIALDGKNIDKNHSQTEKKDVDYVKRNLK
jgi:hypothetical protein